MADDTTRDMPQRIATSICVVRGQRVMLDEDLAGLYGVATKVLNQAVRRNVARFPADFLFRLTEAEEASLRSHFVTLESGRGKHRKYPTTAFNEWAPGRCAELRQDAGETILHSVGSFRPPERPEFPERERPGFLELATAASL